MRDVSSDSEKALEPASSWSSSDMCVQLEENFRMSVQLCKFVESIYRKRFQPMHTRREIAHLGACIREHLPNTPQKTWKFLRGMADVMELGDSNILQSPIDNDRQRGISQATTLFLLKLVSKLGRFSPAEQHVCVEAQIVSNLVFELSKAFTSESIFVVTPHRVQRSLVTQQLKALNAKHGVKETSPRIWVDTTERLQGGLN
jgi:AAA domain